MPERFRDIPPGPFVSPANPGFWQPDTLLTPPGTAPISLVNTWTAVQAIGGGTGLPAPPAMSLACPVTNSDTNWLFAFCSWTLPAGYLGSTVTVADDGNNAWFPLGAPDGTSAASGSTRCSIWAAPAAFPAHNVFVSPCGLPGPVYPAVLGVTVIEVSGLSAWLGTPVVVTASAAATTLIAGAPAPTGQALMLTVAASDTGTPAQQATGWQPLVPVTGTSGDGLHNLSTSPAWQVSATAQPASWSVPAAANLSACTAVVLAASPAPPQPAPFWPAFSLRAGFGSGALTPVDQVTWTDITPRWLAGADTTIKAGKQYELDALETGEETLNLDNSDGALTPANTASPFWPDVVADTPLQLLAWWQGRTYSLFSSFTERLPPSWDASWYGIVEVGAADAWALQQNQLNSVLREEMAWDGPYAYWTCGDNAGSVVAQNLAPGNVNGLQVVTSKSGALTAAADFGADSGMLPGDPSGTAWAQSGLTSGANGYGFCLYCADSAYPPLTTGITVMGWFNPTGAGTQISANLILVRGTNASTGSANTASCEVHLNNPTGGTPGAVGVTVWDRITKANTTTVVDSGDWLTAGAFHIALQVTTTTWALYLNGSQAGTGTCNLAVSIDWLSFMGSADRYFTGGMLNGECAHLGVYPQLLPADRVRSIYLAGTPSPQTVAGGTQVTVPNAQFAGEYPAQRIERLLAYGGWAGPRAISQSSVTPMTGLTDIQGDSAVIAASGQVTVTANGQQAATAASNIVFSDGGFAYTDGNGVICYLSRTDLFGQAPQWALGENAATILNITPYFTTGITPWTASNGATVSWVPQPPYWPDPALLFTGDGATPGPQVQPEATIPVTGALPYTVSAALYCPQGWLTTTLSAAWYTSTGGPLGTSSTAFPVPAGSPVWQAATVWAPIGAVAARITVQMTGTPAATVQMYAFAVILADGNAEIPYEPDIVLGYDKSLLYNVAELSPAGSTASPVLAENAASAAQHGTFVFNTTAYQQDIGQVGDEANWIASTRGTVSLRAESFTVDAAANPFAWPFLLRSRPATPIVLNRRPQAGPAVPLSVQPITAQVTKSIDYAAGTAQVKVTTDAFPEGAVLTAGDPVRGLLDGTHPLAW